MRIAFYGLLLLAAIGLVACSTTEIPDSSRRKAPEVVETQSPTAAATIPANSPIPTAFPPTIPSPMLIITDMGFVIDVPATITATTTPGAEQLQIASFGPDAYSRSSPPSDVWWSEDGQVLYYQDTETEQAWEYVLATGRTTEVPYVPRTWNEMVPKILETLPENAKLLGLSPSTTKILYSVPLPEPIPFPENPDSPPYHYELWLRQDGQDFQLGLVDGCFGWLGPHHWSTNENVVIVNTYSGPCLHTSWLVDLDELTAGPLDTPWEGEERYWVNEVSADGNLLMVRTIHNDSFFFDRTTKEQKQIPGIHTDNVILTETGPSPQCLVLEKEVSDTSVRTHIWNCKPTGKSSLFATFDTRIGRWVISPDRKYVAFISDGEHTYPDRDPIPAGIWLMALP